MFHSSDLSSYYLLNAPAQFRQIYRIIKNESIDAILFANILAGSAAVQAGARCSTPAICDYLDHFPESARAYYPNRAIGQIVRKVVSEVVGWNVRNSTLNVAISDTFKDILIDEYGVKPGRVAIIPNGVDTTVFAPMDREKARDTLGLQRFADFLCICYVGAVERWSGLETVANTVDHLIRQGNKIALFIVGGGLGTRYYPSLLSRFGNHQNFLFTGFVSAEEAAMYIGAADVCVLCSEVSKISAGLPLKLLEYMACKRPVVSTRIQEVIKAVGDAVTMYSSEDELAEILKTICRGGLDLSARVDRAYKFALSRSWNHISQLYEHLITDLVLDNEKRINE
jgi:glycosyltransferase involved in cell wall biosynthesis